MDDIEGQEIHLIQPGEGEVTLPLQAHHWPEGGADRRRETKPGEEWRIVVDDDRSFPRPVTFSWERPRLSADAVPGEDLTYILILTPEGAEGEPIRVSQLCDRRVQINNLRVGTGYTWKVTGWQGGRLVAESKEGHFMTHPEAPRWICVPGISNVRDMGGWSLPDHKRVRQGMVFRGTEMNSHCVITPEGCRVMLEDLKIRTDIDLRGEGEEPRMVLDPKRVRYINIPTMPYDSIANPQFTGRYRELFALLAKPENYPMYIHCWGGADRTGTLLFLIEALLGMNYEDLATDYELTSLSIWGERLRNTEAYEDLLQTLALFAPKGSTLHNQVERYLRVIGVTNEEVEQIRVLLVEPV